MEVNREDIVEALQDIMEAIGVTELKISAMPVVIAEDSPDMRKARLITALKSNRPIQKDKWGLFMDCLKRHLYYKDDTSQHPIDYLLDSLQANQVNEGLVCHLLEMVKE